jgi:hypothetical protein
VCEKTKVEGSAEIDWGGLIFRNYVNEFMVLSKNCLCNLANSDGYGAGTVSTLVYSR